MSRDIVIAATNDFIVVPFDFSSLPQWQGKEIQAYELSVRIVPREQLKVLDGALTEKTAMMSAAQDKDVYVIIRIINKKGNGRRILKLEGYLRGTDNLAEIDFCFSDICSGPNESDVVIKKLYDHTSGKFSVARSAIEGRIAVITKCIAK
jgi:hypothetical protein